SERPSAFASRFAKVSTLALRDIGARSPQKIYERMMEPATTARDGFAQLLRAEWTKFRTVRGCVIGMVVAVIVITLLGLLCAAGLHYESPNDNVRPSVPVGPNGEAVTDRFFFMHQPLAGNGSITARVTSLTGIITYPPPNHDQIVPGVVPWAKAGVI